jgi:hypothetical protein
MPPSRKLALKSIASLLLTILLFRWYIGGNREAGWLIIPTLFPTTTLAYWDGGVVMQ